MVVAVLGMAVLMVAVSVVVVLGMAVLGIAIKFCPLKNTHTHIVPSNKTILWSVIMHIYRAFFFFFFFFLYLRYLAT